MSPRGVFLRTRRPLSDRFWEKVQKTDECWVWLGASRRTYRHKGPDYYGNIAAGGQGGATLGAHVVSWILHYGPVPEKSFVLHRCDNRNCVRPDHLFLGTAQDNTADMIAKGRAAFGIAHHSAKLTEAAVREIRSTTASVVALASRFAVSPATVRDARCGRYWKKVV